MYTLSEYKRDYFELRPTKPGQFNIFMRSKDNGEDELLIGPRKKFKINPGFYELNDYSLVDITTFNCSRDAEPIIDKNFLVIKDPTYQYSIHIRPDSRSQDNYNLSIREFQNLSNLIKDKQEWIFEDDDKHLTKDNRYTPVSLLISLVCFFTLDIGVMPNNIFIDKQNKKYFIFEVFTPEEKIKPPLSSDDTCFFFAEKPDNFEFFFAHMGRFYEKAGEAIGQMTLRLLKAKRDSPYLTKLTEAFTKISRAYALWKFNYSSVSRFTKTIKEFSECTLPKE